VTTVQVRIASQSLPAKRYTGWRCLHIVEGGYQSDPDGQPEVRPSFNAPSIEFTKSMQLLSWELMSRNSNITKNKWRVVYGNTTAFTNGQGYFKSGDPRADWVNNIDTQYRSPRLMKAIICGGMFGKWDRIGDELIGVPGVHGIDARKPMPTVDEVLARHWYFTATTCKYPNVSHFPQGQGQPVLIPYFLVEPTPYPLQWFARWDEEYLPDPIKLYQ
jgi:hypothetical protein